MAYNEEVASRIRDILSGHPDVDEKRMFGGLSFMISGNMACGILNDELVVRVGPDGHQDALAEPHARPMDFTGRPMKGMVYVSPDGYASDESLQMWVRWGVDYASSLPAK